MPTEIADSDGESELISPANAERFLPRHPPETSQSAASNDLGVHFSDFLSQEQHLYEEWRLRSSNSHPMANDIELEPEKMCSAIGDKASSEEQLIHHDMIVMHGGAVQPELAAVDTMSTTSGKRRHSTSDSGEDAGKSDHTSKKRRRRSRAKTYGDSSGRQKSIQMQVSNNASGSASHTLQTCSDLGDRQQQMPSPSALSKIQNILGTGMSMQPPPTGNTLAFEEDERPRQRNRPRRVLSLLESSRSDASREISTSHSSMGNYESINIDFRSAASSRDVNANPFGSLSQTSIEDEVHDTHEEKTALQHGFDNLNTKAFLHANILKPPGITNAPWRWNRYSSTDGDQPDKISGRPESTEPVLVYNDIPNDTHPLPSSECSTRTSRKASPRTSKLPVVDTDGPLINRSFSDNGLVNAELSAKQCGRKAKHQRLLSEPSGRLPDEEVDPNDELVIGLPKEQYKPRPSHSRAATNEILPSPALLDLPTNQHEVRKHEQSSPVKQPTSELNPSDEAFIGMPQESYKPRPSRSRSKKTTWEGEGTRQSETGEAVGEVATSSAIASDAADTPPVKQAKKHVKKTKVKRAKTSAAALLKKSQAMLSEGEDDVLWLETKPSEVKLDLPPDIKREVDFERKEVPATQSGKGGIDTAVKGRVTNERTHKVGKQDEGANTVLQSVCAADTAAAISNLNDELIKRADTTCIVVNIPPPWTSEVEAEPKKRGRKKKSLEVLESPDAELEGPSHASGSGGEAGEGELPDKPSIATTNGAVKKRGRKKRAVEISDGTGDLRESTEHELDPPPLDESAREGSRPALTEKDPNRLVPHANIEKIKQSASASITNGYPSPEKVNRFDFAANLVETPHKQTSKEEDSAKGPTKHSPINPSGGKAIYRVGLSRRAAIPSLLKIVRKDIAQPKEKGKQKKRSESDIPAEDDE